LKETFKVGKEYTFSDCDIFDIEDSQIVGDSFTGVFVRTEYDEVFDETWYVFENNGYFYSFCEN